MNNSNCSPFTSRARQQPLKSSKLTLTVSQKTFKTPNSSAHISNSNSNTKQQSNEKLKIEVNGREVKIGQTNNKTLKRGGMFGGKGSFLSLKTQRIESKQLKKTSINIQKIEVCRKRTMTEAQFIEHIRCTPANYNNPKGLTIQQNNKRLKQVQLKDNEKCLHFKSSHHLKPLDETKTYEEVREHIRKQAQRPYAFKDMSKAIIMNKIQMNLFNILDGLQEPNITQKHPQYLKEHNFHPIASRLKNESWKTTTPN